MVRAFLLAICCAVSASPSTKLLVTVIEARSGQPVAGLTAADFSVMDDRTPRAVEAAEATRPLMDVMLLLDTSLVGGMVQPLAANLIEQLQPKEEMAVVAFHSSADLIQDFTSSRELLRRAVAGVKYGNEPHVLDALYAAIDGGFQNTSFRRVLLLLTAGLEGSSRVSDREVMRLARRTGVSVYPVYVSGAERSLFETLARQTGGASFNLRDMRRTLNGGPPGARIFEVLRSPYTLTLSGNLALGEKLKVEVKRPGRLLVSALPLD